MSQLWKADFPIPKPVQVEKRKKLTGMKWERMRNRLYDEQDGKCGQCGNPIETVPEMHPHHKKLRKAGGGSRDDRRENLIGLCPECHKAIHPGPQWSLTAPKPKAKQTDFNPEEFSNG